MIKLAKIQSGFTIIELVIAMVIASIIAVISAELISQPIDSYNQLSVRSQLVETAQSSIDQMSREINSALPNSVRIGCDGRCIEFLHTINGGRYRVQGPGNPLSFNIANNDSSFDVLGGLRTINGVATGNSGTDCQTGVADCLVIFNTGQGQQNAYDIVGSTIGNIATIQSISATQISFLFPPLTDATGNPLLDDGGNVVTQTAFPISSPMQRFMIVDTPITYYCNNTTQTLQRFEGYPISNVQNNEEQIRALTTPNAMVSDNVSTCSFVYAPASATRNGLVTINLTLSATRASGHVESITLINQVHITNSP